MAKISKMDEWWAGLSIAQKERIAGKAALKEGVERDTTYPACSTWWSTVDDERKKAIHDHCTDAHGYLIPEYQEGNIMSF